MKIKYILLGVFIFAVIIGVNFFLSSSPERLRSTMKKTTTTNDLIQAQTERPKSQLLTIRTSSITEDEIRSFQMALPDKFDVKIEANQDPHQTPPSLILFAEKLGVLYKKARKNIEDANLMINELHNCVLSDAIARSARALCLTNSEKLANRFPELQERVDQIRKEAPDEVTYLVRKKDVFQKKR